MWVGGWYWGNAYVTFFRDVCGLELSDEILASAKAYEDTNSSAMWWWPHSDFVMVCERPKVIAKDDRGRLHREDGPAFESRDGWGIYRWHGVEVPREVIMEPHTITAARIDTERNAEVRRAMIERYGRSRYLKDGGAEKLHTDERGTLWRKPVPNDEALVMVEVLNSTPEPDGSIKTYFLPCHPELRPNPVPANGMRMGEPQKLTASNAIASTFGLRGEQYAPAQET